MALLTSLDASSFAQIVSLLPQRDAIALHASSKSFRDVYPTHITKVFALDATIDEYIAFCRWVAKRTIHTLEVCVDINKWNAVIPILDESSFELVTICPNSLQNIREMVVFPACRSRKSGFLDRNIQMTLNKTSKLYLCPLNDPDVSQHDYIIPSMPYFASEIFETPRTLHTISCNGTLHNLDRVPRSLRSPTNFVISNATIDQCMLNDMAKMDVLRLYIKECQFKDSTIEPCVFHAVHLHISLNVLRAIKNTVHSGSVEIDCDGTIPSVEYPVLRSVLKVRITGRCQSLEAIGALVARSFPNATPQFHVTITPA